MIQMVIIMLTWAKLFSPPLEAMEKGFVNVSFFHWFGFLFSSTLRVITFPQPGLFWWGLLFSKCKRLLICQKWSNLEVLRVLHSWEEILKLAKPFILLLAVTNAKQKLIFELVFQWFLFSWFCMGLILGINYKYI